MASINPNIMSGKSAEHYLFNVNSEWKNDSSIISTDGSVSIVAKTPAVFGGVDGDWTPEHLLIASVVSCFLSTFAKIAAKMKFSPIGIECSAIGHVNRTDDKLRFNQIDIYPRLMIGEETERIKAEQVLLKTQKHCIISNSLCAVIYYHNTVSTSTAQLSS